MNGIDLSFDLAWSGRMIPSLEPGLDRFGWLSDLYLPEGCIEGPLLSEFEHTPDTMCNVGAGHIRYFKARSLAYLTLIIL